MRAQLARGASCAFFAMSSAQTADLLAGGRQTQRSRRNFTRSVSPSTLSSWVQSSSVATDGGAFLVEGTSSFRGAGVDCVGGLLGNSSREGGSAPGPGGGAR